MKVFVISRRNFIWILGGLLGGILLLCLATRGISAAVAASNTKRKIPIYCVEKQEKVISISFDAAWGNEDTQTLIDILGAHNVKATFFVVGQWVDKYPESVKALSDAGHEIQNHSNTHPHLPQLSKEKAVAEVTACNEKIQAVTGKCPTLLRAPYGDYNNMVVDAMQELGMYTIQWDVDSLDWKGISGKEIYERVVSRVKPGSIVLFHNAAEHTPEALGDIITTLQGQGYTFVPISELIYPDVYTGDHEGRQHPSVS